jgi:hypothetical protein
MATDTSSAYEKNTKEQYEALGRFIEAFEAMVHEARTCCIDMLAIGLTNARRQLIAIPLYHQSFSAKPTFDVFRAVFNETIREEGFRTKHTIADADIDCFSGVLGAISGEYEKLASKRNNLLHGTWYIGYQSADDAEASTFYIDKFATTGNGLSPVDMPKTAADLDDLRKRCEEARTWISTLHGCLPTSSAGLQIKECFEVSGKVWKRIWPSPHTFP